MVGHALLKSSVQLTPFKRVTGGMGVNDINAVYDYIFLIDVIMGSFIGCSWSCCLLEHGRATAQYSSMLYLRGISNFIF